MQTHVSIVLLQLTQWLMKFFSISFLKMESQRHFYCPKLTMDHVSYDTISYFRILQPDSRLQKENKRTAATCSFTCSVVQYQEDGTMLGFAFPQ